jgi:hypothetical protein
LGFHACIPSYPGGRDGKIGLEVSLDKVMETLSEKQPKVKRARGVAQVGALAQQV